MMPLAMKSIQVQQTPIRSDTAENIMMKKQAVSI